MNSKISNKIKRIAEDIARYLDFEQFIIYGGTAVDLLNNKPVNDYDIAIKLGGKKSIIKLRNLLKNRGFTIIEPWREYTIHKNKKVILIYAENKEYFLDIAFLKDFTLIGNYDIESVYISYPEMRIVDKYHGLKNLNIKRINLIREIESENPYVLLGRFIYLCAKYDISLSYKKHRNMLINLKRKCEKYRSKSAYFNRQVIPSFYSHVFKAICKSGNKLKFIGVLIEIEVFDKTFPSLKEALTKIIENKDLTDKLLEIGDKQKLINFLITCLEKTDRMDFLKEITKLKIRKWENFNAS
ncbi:MAG: hypothetical protein ACP5D2_02145 [Candidatus Nanoarchaeia archaeon]